MCVSAQATEYTEPHTVYTPVETISDPLPDTEGTHSLRETQAKSQKCRGEKGRERVGWLWGENQEEKDERKRQ